MSTKPVVLTPGHSAGMPADTPAAAERRSLTRSRRNRRGSILLVLTGLLAIAAGSFMVSRFQPELYALASSPVLAFARAVDLGQKHQEFLAGLAGAGLVSVGGISLVLASVLSLFELLGPHRRNSRPADSLGI